MCNSLYIFKLQNIQVLSSLAWNHLSGETILFATKHVKTSEFTRPQILNLRKSAGKLKQPVSTPGQMEGINV